MPAPGTPLEKLGFLTIGLFDANDPRPGHETTLDVIALGEQLGFDTLYAHAGFREVREVVFALPFSFEHEDYVQLLTDIATHLGPALGWAGP